MISYPAVLRFTQVSVLRDHSWQRLGDPMRCQGLNADGLCVRQEHYLTPTCGIFFLVSSTPLPCLCLASVALMLCNLYLPVCFFSLEQNTHVFMIHEKVLTPGMNSPGMKLGSVVRVSSWLCSEVVSSSPQGIKLACKENLASLEQVSQLKQCDYLTQACTQALVIASTSTVAGKGAGKGIRKDKEKKI